MEHFREQLILKGYASKFIQIDQAEQEKIEEYTAIVMYRCSKLMEAEMLANRAKAAGIPVYYDVDDLVFNYEKISGLHFLKEASTVTSAQLQTVSADVWDSATDILHLRRHWQERSGKNFRKNRW